MEDGLDAGLNADTSPHPNGWMRRGRRPKVWELTLFGTERLEGLHRQSHGPSRGARRSGGGGCEPPGHGQARARALKRSAGAAPCCACPSDANLCSCGHSAPHFPIVAAPAPTVSHIFSLLEVFTQCICGVT